MTSVRYGKDVWSLAPGGVLTFGRGQKCDIRLADDQHVSRSAGAVIDQGGYLVIRNDSTSKPIVLRPPAGEDRLIEPAAATTSLPLRRFDLVLFGAGGVPLVMSVDAGTSTPEPERDPAGGAGTVTAPITFTRTQRRVLLALCEPVLIRRGPAARPATYAEVGLRLELKQGYVRNVVKSVREALTGHGIAGLEDDGQVDDFRRPLVQWAVRSGWVSRDQLAELDHE